MRTESPNSRHCVDRLSPDRGRRRAAWARIWLVAALIAGLALTVLPAPSTRAASIVVNSATDISAADSQCTLREAIAAANTDTATGGCAAGSGADTITFAPGLTGPIKLTTDQLAISSDLTITGPGANALTVQRSDAVNTPLFRVFSISSGTVTITGLKITNGNRESNGGGIFNSGHLTVSSSIISGNSGDNGGGIFNGMNGTLRVESSEISDNTARGNNAGGGLYSNNNGIMTIIGSTISGNTASYGGGLLAFTNTTTTITNTTITGNTAIVRGSGISNSSGGQATLRNVTIAGNTSTQGGAQLHSRDTGTVTTLINTLLANSAQPNCGVETPATNVNGGYNLDDDSFCGFGSANGTQSGVSAELATTLAANGGPTRTLALLVGSPALDAGDSAICAAEAVGSVDQRGIVRPQGIRCDIGAFEDAALRPVPTLSSIAPTSALIGTSPTLVLAGTNFVHTATVQFGGTTLTPSAVTATSITVTVPANLLASVGIVPVTVTNPGPGGGVSGVVDFAVENPVPGAITLLPSTATAGDGSLALTVNGTNFVTGSAIDFGGQRLDTTVVNAGQLTATIPASALRAAGNIDVRVITPGPGGGTSSPATFVVNPAGANQLASDSGNGQSATINTAFATALTVTVRDQYSNPVPGTTVTFTAPASGANGTFAGGVTTVQTNSSGVATAPAFTANGVVGSYTVIASAGGGAVPFSLTNTPGPATNFTVVTPASAVSGATVPVTVTARDAAGNLAPGYTGTVHFTSGDAQATLPADSVLVTGTGTFAVTLKTAGAQTITVADTIAPSISGNATVLVAPTAPTSLSATGGTPQSQPINNSYGTLAATARDAFDNTVPGVIVTFAAPASGPSATFPGGGLSATTSTDSNGIATAPTVTANGVAGSYSVVASSGAGSAIFALTNTTGQAGRLTIALPSQAAAGMALTLTATVLDAGGNIATDYTGTLHFTGSDPQATLPADSMLVNGTGTFAVTLHTAGTQTVTVSDTINGAPVASATVTVTTTEAATITAVGGTPQGAQNGTAFTAPLVAVIRDGSGNPLAGRSVTFTTPTDGPSATFGGGHSAVAITDASGIATSPALVANGTAGTYNATASTSGVATPATFALTNTTGVIPTLNVMVTATGGGSVTPGSGSYAVGSIVAFTATPDSTNIFLGWTVEGQFVGLANPLSLPITGARTVEAHFAPRPAFPDVAANDPAAEAIAQLAARGIIRGTQDGTFNPSDQTLRSQSAALIARAMGWEGEPHGNLFPDKCDQNGQNCIDDELWNDVAALNFYNVARGYSDAGSCAAATTTTPCYLPRVPVAKVQVIAFITRAMVAKGYWQSATSDDPNIYPNVPASSGHRLDLVTYASNAGAIPGQPFSGAFSGYDQPATRAFFAEALWQAYNTYFSTNRLP